MRAPIAAAGLCAATFLASSAPTLADTGAPTRAAAVAPAAAALHQGAIDLEVDETTRRGVATSSRFTAAVALDERPASLRAAAGGADVEVKIAWRGGRGATPLLYIDFKQQRQGQRPIELEVPAYLARGVRTVVGSVVRPDGSRLSLSATLR